MVESRRAFAAVVAGIGLVVAGCGGTDFARRTVAPAPVPAEKPSAAPVRVALVRNPALQALLVGSVAHTTAARTARTSISVTLTGLGEDALSTGAFDIAGTGGVDFATGDADLSLSIPRFDRLGGGGTIEQRIVRGVVYTKMPSDILRVSGMPASVRWLSFDETHVGGGDPAALSQSQVDPAGQLAFLAAVSVDVRRVGPEPVRGVAATHYAATIDLGHSAHVADRLSAVRAKLVQLGAMIGARRLGVDVWVDAAGRARRVVVSVPLSRQTDAAAVAGLGSDAMMRIQADFYAFGVTLRVAAPPQAAVRPYSALRLGATDG